MNEIFVWWPLIAAAPVAIILGFAMAAMLSDEPEATPGHKDNADLSPTGTHRRRDGWNQMMECAEGARRPRRQTNRVIKVTLCPRRSARVFQSPQR